MHQGQNATDGTPAPSAAEGYRSFRTKRVCGWMVDTLGEENWHQPGRPVLLALRLLRPLVHV